MVNYIKYKTPVANASMKEMRHCFGQMNINKVSLLDCYQIVKDKKRRRMDIKSTKRNIL